MSISKKYEMIKDNVFDLRVKGIVHVLYRIVALKDFGDIKKGDIGGWVESDKNLSQEGDCWIYDNAKAYGDAKVNGNANVSGNAWVYGNAKVTGNAIVFGNANVYGNAQVYEDAFVFGDTWVSGNALVHGNAKVSGGALVYGNANVNGDAKVYGTAQVYEDALVCGTSFVFGNALVHGNAKVYGTAYVSGYAEICGNAEIRDETDYSVFKNFWSSGRWFTWTRSNNMWRVGCFYGTGKELIAQAKKDSKKSGKCYAAVVKFVETALKAERVDWIAKILHRCW